MSTHEVLFLMFQFGLLLAVLTLVVTIVKFLLDIQTKKK